MGIGGQEADTNADALTAAVAVSNKRSFVSEPEVSCLLPAFTKLQQANLLYTEHRWPECHGGCQEGGQGGPAGAVVLGSGPPRGQRCTETLSLVASGTGWAVLVLGV